MSVRVLSFLYGGLAYLGFLAAFLYAVGFVAGVVVPKGIDDGAVAPLGEVLAVNLGLMTLFAVQHSVMARPWFKRRWTQVVSPAIERSTFVLLTALILGLLYWQWRPLPTPVWSVEAPLAVAAIHAVCAAGWLFALIATFAIGHFELFGLSQVWHHLRGTRPTPPRMVEPGPYRVVRHPIMLGFLVAFWATPHMTVGHLLFAGVVTAYVLVAVYGLEERDLLREHGAGYRAYKQRVPGLLPLPRPRGRAPAAARAS